MKLCFPAVAAGMLLLVAVVSGCAPSDPRERILEERTRWKVALLGWAQAEDGTITLSARVLGPVSSELDKLTVRLVLQDATGNDLGSEWWTLDLSEFERGGPEDLMLRLAPRGVSVDAIGIDPVPVPTDGELQYIEELKF